MEQLSLPFQATKTILEEAEELTKTKRNEDYGTYSDNANKAVDIYRALKGHTHIINAADVALFQVSHKLAREMCRPKRDNVVDACGYLKLYYQELQNDATLNQPTNNRTNIR